MDQRMFPESPHGRRARLLIEDPSPALPVAEFRRFQDAGFRPVGVLHQSSASGDRPAQGRTTDRSRPKVTTQPSTGFRLR